MTSQGSQIENFVSTVKFSGWALRAASEYGELLNMRTLEKDIGRRVKELIAEKDTSQEALAPKVGISKNHLSNLIAGKRRWNLDRIVDVATGLGAPIWRLFVDPQDVIPAEYIDLMDKYRRLDSVRKQAVDDIFAAAHAAEEKKLDEQNGRSKKAS